MDQDIIIEIAGIKLKGHITCEADSKAWVVFAHGSGSSHKSPRNTQVAKYFNRDGYATLLFDLLTEEEDKNYQNRFDIPELADRLYAVTRWLLKREFYHQQPLAYFGASTGAAAAIIAGSRLPRDIPLFTVISRGGRADLADKKSLNSITVPVLLIVGSLDYEVIALNEYAKNQIRNSKLTLIDGATHLFEEPGTLEQVMQISLRWLNLQIPDLRFSGVEL